MDYHITNQLVIHRNMLTWLSFNKLVYFISAILITFGQVANGQKATFLPGGDMFGFTIPESTKVGSVVYQLKASNPGRGRLSYYISGDSFSVAKDSGAVTLIRPLDRETESTLDVIITIVDDSSTGSTLSIKREIKVADDNDNHPVWQGAPYKFAISESTKLFTTVIEGIQVTDADAGRNAQIEVSCDQRVTPEACSMFNVRSSLINQDGGLYSVSISLKGIPLNYELTSVYNLALIAVDTGGLRSSTNVTIAVVDVQDEPPKFLNGPYSITVNESTPSGSSVLTIIVRDGDNSPSIRRDIQLEIVDDKKKYFTLSRIDSDSWSLLTSNILMDREDPEILLAGGIYSCTLRATELVPVTGHSSVTFGAISSTNVTVVIQDINDQEPRFNLDRVMLEVSEDITNGSAVPSLNLIVSDPDAGHNAKFTLSIEDLDENNPASQVFTVSPSLAMGRTPVILKVINSDGLDFENPTKRTFLFNIVAAQENIRSVAFINLTLVDANDNQPIFNQAEYFARVKENENPGKIFYSISAYDADSGAFGRITYSLKGFGSDKFSIDSESGEISVADCSPETAKSYSGSGLNKDIECLDYEAQPSYSLRVEATDGGGKRSTANLHVEIVDINDNVPKFLRALYVRELNEKDVTIYPPLILRATDEDGPTQGGTNGIRYRVKWTNLTGLAIDPISGDVKLTQSIHANFTRNRETGLRKKLNYEAIIEAVDGGDPPLSAEAVIQIYVRSARDGEPLFINEPFNATVKENADPGTVVITVKATDPDGPDSKLRYSLIAGAKDNFIIDPSTGEVKVSSAANLDRDLYGKEYSLTVAVTDSGHPIPLTSTAQLTVIVEDVNNKAPKFGKDGYVIYLSDSQFAPGYEIMTARATDSDSNAKIRYDLDLERIKVRDKTGALVGRSEYFNNLLKIDPVTGVIRVNGTVDSEKASIIVVPVVAHDINGEPDDQKAFTDLTIYIQSHGERNPIFIPPWTPSEPTYEINLPEETLIGSTVFTLAARNPLTGKPITNFKKIDSTDPEGYFSVNKLTGVITLNKRIDYESLVVKQIKFSVEAVGQPDKNTEEYLGGEKFTSIANILVSVSDINDNSPVFLQDVYRASIIETAKWPQIVLTVSATDRDSGSFGEIGYSLSGDGSDMFEIGNRSGILRIRQGANLDRESKANYNLQVTAFDNFRDNEDSSEVNGERNSATSETRSNGGFRGIVRKTTVSITIELIDVNDNSPKFSHDLYEVIVPESAPVGSRAGSVMAIDPDEGRNGEVHYEISFLENFPDPREELFIIDRSTGELFVNKSLSGKGRSEPYLIHITARDSGREPFTSHTKFSIIIGDVAANDGIPKFVRPTEDEIIYLTENTKPGTLVYTVSAVDADNNNSPNGRVMYKFAEPSPYFDIDSTRGTIVTSRNVGKTVFLDREKQENFTLILVAFDLGNPPQESQRIMIIRLNDTDDNTPHFNRVPGDSPMIWEIDEEIPVGSLVGTLKAIDDDIGQNALINYFIIYESIEGAIIIETRDNMGLIKVAKRLDREEIESISLVVQARPASKYRKLDQRKSSAYNPNDLSQVEVKIILKDIDDNPPKFNQDYFLTGIRWDTPVHSDLLTFSAIDPDPSDSLDRGNMIEYSISEAKFVNGNKITNNMSHVFDLGRTNGRLQNDMMLKSFVGGYFLLTVQAISTNPAKSKAKRESRQISSVPVRILIIREKDFVKFVFNKSPNTVESNLNELKNDLEKALEPLSLKWSFNFQEAHFHERKDGSLDFEATSACFQILDAPINFLNDPEAQHGAIVSYKDALKSLKNNSFSQLKQIYSNYGIVSIEECIKPSSQPLLSRQQLGIVLVAIFIACCTLLLTLMALNMRSDLKRKLNTVSNCVGIASQSQIGSMLGPHLVVPGQPPFKPAPFLNIPNQERIYEWQETMNPQLDALSARSFPTLR
ncbi:cadherin-23 [Tetranychus urticae]|uniref:Cadherin domain-containing protein n=1 Tax=Tetranychus urticae TaxID=32264 RepID=T1K1S5_TETUR|nr:cadherin-23 [Tetranychus urticae]XP_015781900.1 cadherin-23 [Tetranychus urticae]